MKFKARAYRSRHKAGTMNQTEKLYAQHLEQQKRLGLILDWQFEPETLKLGKDCRYTPDFRVIKPIGQTTDDRIISDLLGFSEIEFREVKGTIRKKNTTKLQLNTTKPYIEDDALVKIKTAAELHPYKFILVWMGLNGNWESKEIN